MKLLPQAPAPQPAAPARESAGPTEASVSSNAGKQPDRSPSLSSLRRRASDLVGRPRSAPPKPSGGAPHPPVQDLPHILPTLDEILRTVDERQGPGDGATPVEHSKDAIELIVRPMSRTTIPAANTHSSDTAPARGEAATALAQQAPTLRAAAADSVDEITPAPPLHAAEPPHETAENLRASISKAMAAEVDNAIHSVPMRDISVRQFIKDVRAKGLDFDGAIRYALGRVTGGTFAADQHARVKGHLDKAGVTDLEGLFKALQKWKSQDAATTLNRGALGGLMFGLVGIPLTLLAGNLAKAMYNPQIDTVEPAVTAGLLMAVIGAAASIPDAMGGHATVTTFGKLTNYRADPTQFPADVPDTLVYDQSPLRQGSYSATAVLGGYWGRNALQSVETAIAWAAKMPMDEAALKVGLPTEVIGGIIAGALFLQFRHALDRTNGRFGVGMLMSRKDFDQVCSRLEGSHSKRLLAETAAWAKAFVTSKETLTNAVWSPKARGAAKMLGPIAHAILGLTFGAVAMVQHELKDKLMQGIEQLSAENQTLHTEKAKMLTAITGLLLKGPLSYAPWAFVLVYIAVLCAEAPAADAEKASSQPTIVPDVQEVDDNGQPLVEGGQSTPERSQPAAQDASLLTPAAALDSSSLQVPATPEGGGSSGGSSRETAPSIVWQNV